MQQLMTPRTGEEIQTWLCTYIAKIVDLPIAEVDPDATFNWLGLDSATTVALTGDLGKWLGIDVHPTLPWDYPTTRKLALLLAEELQRESLARKGS
jgi:acyl carrier protein